MRRNYILSAICLVLAQRVALEYHVLTPWWFVTIGVAAYAQQPFFNLAFDAIGRYLARRRARHQQRKDGYYELVPRRTGA